MSVLLICPRDKGNTFDVCKYVLENSEAELMILNKSEVADLKKYRSIILCSGVYVDNVHKNHLRWLEQLDRSSFHENVTFYMFLTWFGRGQSDKNAVGKVRSTLEKMNMALAGDYFSCYGGKGPVRVNHPNTDDYSNALNWVESQVFQPLIK